MPVDESQSVHLDVTPALAWERLSTAVAGLAVGSLSHEVNDEARSAQIVTTDGSRLAVTSIHIVDSPPGSVLRLSFSCPNPGWKAPLIAREMRRDLATAAAQWKQIAEASENAASLDGAHEPSTTALAPERRPCPRCGESIPRAARICRFCQLDVSSGAA